MNFFVKIWHSSLGKKYLMGVSGFVLVAFIIVHLLGNLQLFAGPYWINTYGQFLHERHEILWPVRIILLTMVGLHIWASLKLRAENQAARPLGYANDPVPLAASYASRTMMMSGLIIAAFAVFHLLHYALGVRAVNLTGIDFSKLRDSADRPDLYLMLLLGFSQWPVSVFYVIAIGLLCLHLSHGVRAMFQSIGWKWTFGGVPHLPDRIARWFALAIFILYASIPTAVMCGFGKAYKERALGQLTAGAVPGMPAIQPMGAPRENKAGGTKHPTSNIQHPTPNALTSPSIRCSTFDPSSVPIKSGLRRVEVRCSMFPPGSWKGGRPVA